MSRCWRKVCRSAEENRRAVCHADRRDYAKAHRKRKFRIVKLCHLPLERGTNGFWKCEGHPAGGFRIERFEAAFVDGAVYPATAGTALHAAVAAIRTEWGDSHSISRGQSQLQLVDTDFGPAERSA